MAQRFISTLSPLVRVLNMTRSLTRSALLLTLLIICSQISLPVGPVPITLQTFAVMMISLLCLPRQTGFILGIYLMLGLIGFPVFSGANGGLQSILLPSFGFVVGFIPSGILISYLNQNQLKIPTWIILLIGNLILYSIGLTYMAWVLTHVNHLDLSMIRVLQLGMIPFIPGDILKIILASSLLKYLRGVTA